MAAPPVLGVRAWAGIALGVVLVIAPNGALSPLSVLDTVGCTAAPVLAPLLLRRVGFRADLARRGEAVAARGAGPRAPARSAHGRPRTPRPPRPRR